MKLGIFLVLVTGYIASPLWIHVNYPNIHFIETLIALPFFVWGMVRLIKSTIRLVKRVGSKQGGVGAGDKVTGD